MDRLDQNWLTQGHIDFEYKKYILLAYLKGVKDHFKGERLYPFMADLLFHYQNMHTLKGSKQWIHNHFPKQLSGIDFTNWRLEYEKLMADDEVMKELGDIIEYALPKMKTVIEEGKEVFETVEENLELFPVGISPIYKQEGYLFVEQIAKADVQVYRYQTTVFENVQENYRGINMEYVGNEQWSISNTYEQIKLRLIKNFTQWPNPATFVVRSKRFFPFQETLLPIAKRLLIRHVSVA